MLLCVVHLDQNNIKYCDTKVILVPSTFVKDSKATYTLFPSNQNRKELVEGFLNTQNASTAVRRVGLAQYVLSDSLFERRLF